MMAQITSGVRAVLSWAPIYNLSQNLLGAKKARKILVRDYFPSVSGLRMLDIGCGTAEILEVLPEDTDYTGFDLSEHYVEKARKRFGARGTFFAERVSKARLENIEPYDLVLAIGILHHLDDWEAKELFRMAAQALKPEGLLVTLDPVFSRRQSPVAKWIIRRDRGRNVREANGYERLARTGFQNVRVDVRHDLLWIPYTHAILQCRLPIRA